MSNNFNDSTKASGAVFNRIVVVALLTIAFALAGLNACQRGVNKAVSPEKISCPPFPLEPHEPPITITNGSLKLDLEKPLTERTGTGPRLFVYSIAPERYIDIKKVQVITETSTGIFDSSMYLPRQRSELRIWLQNKLANGSWTSITNEPQVVFTFDASATPLSIESERKFEPAESDKPERPYRYIYKEFPTSEALRFRVAKWSLNKLSDHSVIFQDELNARTLGFQIVPFFIHEHED